MTTPDVAGDLDTGESAEPAVDVVDPTAERASERLTVRDSSDHCAACGHSLAKPPGRGPFGFGLTRCESCKRRRWYPLARGVRIFYWIVLATTVVGLVGLLGGGIAAVPGAAALVAAALLSIDANLRGKHVTSNAIVLAMTAVTVSGFSLGLFAAGMANGYSFEVVDRPSQQITEFTAISFERGPQLCSGGADYQACVYMHAAMHSSVCATSDWPRLTGAARSTCNELEVAVQDMLAQSRSCGYGCTTRANADGRWGWSYLRPVAVTTQVTIDRVSHLETCWFTLGPVKLGNCPRD